MENKTVDFKTFENSMVGAAIDIVKQCTGNIAALMARVAELEKEISELKQKQEGK